MRTDGRTDGQTDRQTRQANMTKLIAVFQNFATVYVYMTTSVHTTQQQIWLLGIQILDIKTPVGNKLWRRGDVVPVLNPYPANVENMVSAH